MTLLAAALLASSLAAAGEPVEGTHWELTGSPWTERERQVLTDLSRSLPPVFLDPGPPVELRRAPAEPSAEPSPGPAPPHSLAEPRRGGRVIVLHIDGLSDGMPDGMSDELEPALRRQLAHALAHAADHAHGWSRSPAWRRISGWHRPSLGRRPEERDALSFASPFGRVSRSEDLATTAEAWLVRDRLPDDPPLAVPCRMPSKVRFLAERAGPSSVAVSCAELADVGLDPDEVESIELVLARASARNPASMLGHTLVSVVRRPDPDAPEQREAFELVAVTDGTRTGGARYVARGLTGQFPSQVHSLPYRTVQSRYALENRGLVRLRLDLDEAQEQAVLERLDELRQSWDRPYLYLQRNCTELPAELLEAALGDDLGLPPIFTVDALLGAAERKGLVASVEPQSVAELSPADRGAMADGLRREAEVALRAAHPDHAASFEQTHDRNTAVRAGGYRALAAIADDPGLEPWLAWSEAFEEASRLKPRHDSEDRAALDGIRTARSALRAAGVGPSSEATRALLAEAPPALADASTHSPLMRVEVMAVSGADHPVGLSLASHLYRGRLGEARRYSLPIGLDATVLRFDLTLATDRMAGLSATLVRMLRLWGTQPGGNIGFHFQLLDAEVALPGGGRLRVAEAGPAVELLQAWDHRAHLVATVGGGAVVDWSPVAVGAVAPMALSGRLGARRQALTGLELRTEWVPGWTTAGRWTDASAVGGAQLRLGEIGGADIALAAEARLVATRRDDTWTAPGPEARLGLWIERW